MKKFELQLNVWNEIYDIKNNDELCKLDQIIFDNFYDDYVYVDVTHKLNDRIISAINFNTQNDIFNLTCI